MFHYVACGLPNVWLANGYSEASGDDGSTFFNITDVRDLHKAIGHFLTEKEALLTGEEFRFLRSELRMSRRVLADLLGISDETIKKWESGGNPMQKMADATLRQLFLQAQEEDGAIRELLTLIKDLERHEGRLCFTETQQGWEAAEEQCA